MLSRPAANVAYFQGKTYLQEHNYAKAYVLLLRYSIICMDKIPTHPDAGTPEGHRLIRASHRRLKAVLPLLESIKARLLETRERWDVEHSTSATAANRMPFHHASTGDDHDEFDDVAAFAARDPALLWNPHMQTQLLDASEHVNLAVELANKRHGQQQASGGSDEDLRPPQPLSRRSTEADDNNFAREMERARWRLDEMARKPNYEDDGGSGPIPVSYNYPLVRRSTPVQYESMQFEPPSSTGASAQSAAPPRRPSPPPKRPTAASLSAPARRPPISSYDDAPPSYDYNDDLASLRRPAPPPPPPKTKVAEPEPAVEAPPLPEKSQYTFKPAAYLENGAPIRSVFLPDTLRQAFLRIAQPNTSRGIETCGILCGKTANNALFITCLLIPQQTGTADSCETMGEVETFEYCSAEDLIQIGWIHTHPTQTCFLSSLDMHTHAGYQMMMDESIAIVCAPRFEPSWGIFRLTNPPGLPYIGGCRKEGAFHEHSLRAHEIYTDARNPPGHVFVVPGIDYKVADLRK